LRKILFIKVKRNMEIKDYVKQFRDLQKSHKKVRVADFCRENMLDYYEMVEALKQDKFESESYEGQVQCGDLVITEIPESGESTQPMPATESYIKEVMLSFPKGLKLTVREITPSDLVTIVQRLMSVRNYA
jgi:dynactin complex subunit